MSVETRGRFVMFEDTPIDEGMFDSGVQELAGEMPKDLAGKKVGRAALDSSKDFAELVRLDEEIDGIIYAAKEAKRRQVEVTGGVGMYLNQIGRIALLEPQHEVELAKRIEAGVYAKNLLGEDGSSDERDAVSLRVVAAQGEEAKKHFYEANLRLVVEIAKRYRFRGLSFADLIQEGNIGLMKAVDGFDYTKGLKFSTYAEWKIRKAIKVGLTEKGRPVRLPQHIEEKIDELVKAERELPVQLGRTPTREELAAEIKESVNTIDLLYEYRQSVKSLDAPTADGVSQTLFDVIKETPNAMPEDENSIAREVKNDRVAGALAGLTDQQREMLSAAHGLNGAVPLTPQEIADKFGVKRVSVYTQLRRAKEKLNKSLEGMYDKKPSDAQTHDR